MNKKKLEFFILQNIRWIVLVSIILFFLMLCMWNVKYAHDYKLPRHITIGIAVPTFPFYAMNQKKISSFEIELTDLLMKKIGISYSLKKLSYTDLVQKTEIGKIQLSIAAIDPSLDKKVIFIPIPKIKATPLLALTIKPIPGPIPENYSSLRVLVEKESYAEETLKNLFIQDLKTYPSLLKCLRALEMGEGDVVVLQASSLTHLSGTPIENKLLTHALPTLGYPFTIMVSRYYEPLADYIEFTLECMQRDGSLDALKKKWNINL